MTTMDEDRIDAIGFMLEEKGLSHDAIDEFFEHQGVKGMKWGVRKATGSDRRAGRREVREVGKSARSAIKASRRARTADERKAAVDHYQTQVMNKIRTPEFKRAYSDANTMGKGEMLAHVITLGPLAAITIPAARRGYENRQITGYAQEMDASRSILREMKRGN